MCLFTQGPFLNIGACSTQAQEELGVNIPGARLSLINKELVDDALASSLLSGMGLGGPQWSPAHEHALSRLASLSCLTLPCPHCASWGPLPSELLQPKPLSQDLLLGDPTTGLGCQPDDNRIPLLMWSAEVTDAGVLLGQLLNSSLGTTAVMKRAAGSGQPAVTTGDAVTIRMPQAH